MTPRPLEVEIYVDSFAGGGGASKGMELALGRGPDIAINHDAEAIALHTANHPDTKHYCEDVWRVDPREACAGRPVGLMWLSPDCKDFSKAKGGRPVNKKVRGLAWVAVRWAVAVRPRVIVLENVEEFQGWGPLLTNGKRNPEKVGYTFRRFVGRLRALGYVVEWKELRACDYGAPTIRKRLFLIARCDGHPIVWPVPTHGKGRALPWRTAAECIDFSIPCYSIFLTRAEARAQRLRIKRPIVEATLRRIGAGMRRFVFECERPFIIGVGGRMGQSPPRSLSQPYQTITAKADAALIEPFLVEYHSTKPGGPERVADLAMPLRVQSTENRFGLIAPTLIQSGYGERDGQAPRVPGLDKPLGTIVAGGVKHALVAGFLAKHYGGHETPGTPLDRPISTLTTQDHHHLVTSHLLKLRGTSRVGQQLELPMPTITGGGLHLAEVRAFLVAYFGNEKDGGSLRDPMRTVTSRDRFGLVTIEGVDYELVDIKMRMLVARELYRAQGFPDSYVIDVPFTRLTKKGRKVTVPLSAGAQVRMCGNSVCPPLAAAIIAANVERAGAGERVA